LVQQGGTTVALRRRFGLAAIVLGLTAVVAGAAIGSALLYLYRQPTIAERSTLVLRLSGELVEVAPEDVVGQVLRTGRPGTLQAQIEAIRKAKADPRIAHLLVRPVAIDVPLWGKLQELHDAIVDFRRSGKQAVAFLEYAGEREYYLATACDRVFMTPNAILNVNGFASYELFLRGTLDKLGAYPDLHHIGAYKTATNTLTEQSFTDAHREMTEWLNRDLYEQLVRAISDGRKRPEAAVRAIIDEGPFLAEQAKAAGLIDELAYEDQIDDKAPLGTRDLTMIESRDYAEVRATSLGLNKGPRIALIYAAGPITSGRSDSGAMSGVTVGSDTFNEHLRTARADASVRAIVVRVDSPGGSSVASDVIWRELMLTRDEKPDRPLIVSMSDVAASGGYYIAMAGHAIVAQPATLTGSIGIYGGKFVLAGLYEKLGATVETVVSGRNAAMDSTFRTYTDAERMKLEEQLRAFYWQFVEKVARSRKLTPERVHAIAEGRVWTGRQARQLGLVDELGGLDRALALAKQRAKIPPDQEVELIVYPPRRSFLEILASEWRGDTEARVVARWLRSVGLADAFGAVSLLGVFRRGEPLALMPLGMPGVE
jgi:protease-4